jgi:hypothetical protein
VFRLDSYFRLTRRQRLDFTFFDLSRDASTVLEGDIQFGDEVFTVGTLVDTKVDMVVYRLAYGFSFLRTDRMVSVTIRY